MSASYSEQAIFFFYMGKMLGSGIDIDSTMDYLAKESFPDSLCRIAEEWRQCIQKGESLTSIPSVQDEFAPWVIEMISIGEKTGNLDKICVNIYECLEKRITYPY